LEKITFFMLNKRSFKIQFIRKKVHIFLKLQYLTQACSWLYFNLQVKKTCF